MSASMSLPSIPEFYRGLKIFVTGSTGYVGKIFLEKLLRSCPDLHTVYLLLSPEDDMTVQDITKATIFDKLRLENPASFDKLVPVDGSIKELGLGLSIEDRELLQNKVTVIFHLDVGGKTEASLPDAVLANVRGTREMIDLALGMKKLKVFLQMSTTLCNVDKPEVLEQVYPTSHDWRTIIKLVEDQENEEILTLLTTKITRKLPSAYMYSKALAEQVIDDFKDKLPLVILRTSEVTPPVKEPIVGWVDSLDGPMEFWMNCYTSITSVSYANPRQIRDYVPVDLVVNSFIYIAWQRALVTTNPSIALDNERLPVYNCCSLQTPTEEQELMNEQCLIYRNAPTVKSLWFPRATLTSCWANFYLNVMVLHFIPFYLIDLIARIKGANPKLVTKLGRIFAASKRAHLAFRNKSFNFCNTKFLELEKFMLPRDRVTFRYTEVYELTWQQIVRTVVVARETLLKDPLDTLPEARMRMQRLQFVDLGLRCVFLLSVLWLIANSEIVHTSFSTSSATLYAIIMG